MDRAGADVHLELRAELGAGLADLVLVEQVAGLVHGAAGGVDEIVEDDVLRVIDHALEIGRLHVEDDADARGVFLKEPDVRDGHGELDVAHALAADLGLRSLRRRSGRRRCP